MLEAGGLNATSISCSRSRPSASTRELQHTTGRSRKSCRSSGREHGSRLRAVCYIFERVVRSAPRVRWMVKRSRTLPRSNTAWSTSRALSHRWTHGWKFARRGPSRSAHAVQPRSRPGRALHSHRPVHLSWKARQNVSIRSSSWPVSEHAMPSMWFRLSPTL